MWDKDSGSMYAHNIIAWHKDEQITAEQAFEFGKQFAEKWFSGFQTLVAVHKDKDHIHCHLVTNSVSYEDGRKCVTAICPKHSIWISAQVNKSSVQAVDEADKKQKEAEKQLQSLRYQAEQSRRTAEKGIQKLKKRMKLQSEKISEIKFFCGIGYIVAIVFAVCLIEICFL